MDSDRLSRAVWALKDLVAKLRGPDGCPWDARQTDSTIKIYLLEEAYEVLDAIESSSPSDVCQELGDLLFHIFFIARMAEEREEYNLTEVVERITEKMIRRHPHVFGRARADNAEDVADNWAMIKKQEKKVSGDTSSLISGIPPDLPSLLRAHRLTERASRACDDSPNAGDAWDEVLKNFDDLKTAVVEKDNERFGSKMGAFLFCLVNLTRIWGFNSEHLLRVENKEFADRFEKRRK